VSELKKNDKQQVTPRPLTWFDEIWCRWLNNFILILYILICLPLVIYYEIADFIEEKFKQKK